MTDNERNMSRDEMALRLKIETGLRESYESECTMLKKELENIKVAFKMEHDENILRRDSLNRLCDKYRELEKKHEDLQKRQNACADTWVKCEERNDELKRTLEAKNERLRDITTRFNNVTYNYECAIKENEKLKDWKEEGDRKREEIKKLKEKDEEIERLHKKKNDQRAQLNAVQQALLNRNMKIECLTAESENHRQMYLAQLKDNEELRTKLAYANVDISKLKKEVEETRVVYLPNFYLSNIKAKDEEIRTLRKKNLDLKNENEGWKLKYDQAFLNKNREVTALKDEIETLKDALHDDEVEIHKLKEERDYYVADIDLYEKDVTELRAKVKCLEGDISSANKRVEAYKNDYYRVLNTYNDRIEELNCEVDRLNKEKEKLEAENAVQKAQIHIDNMYMTYYANGPVWTNDDSSEEETADIHATLKEDE